jgi:hypothetical protein
MSRLVLLLAVCVIAGLWAGAASGGDPRTIDLRALIGDRFGDANARTDVPILVPEEISVDVPRKRLKITTTAFDTRYEFEVGTRSSCYHSLACTIGWFSGQEGPRAGPAGGRPDLAKRVKLLGGVRGFYKLSKCGAVCSLPQIQWAANGFVYTIAWKSSRESERDTLVELANAAIRGGVRG